MAWASETAALETDTPFRFLVLEIDLTDPDGVMPNSGQWPASLTLYLSDQYRHRTSAGAGYLTRYWGQVKDWGRFSSSIEPSTAFASIGDAQITLRNVKATNQEPASTISGPSTPTPEGVMDDLRFAQLCQLYKWKGAAVRVAVISVANGQGDQSVSGWGYRTVRWQGIVAETDFVRGDFVIDVIQSNEHTRADLPGREIDGSWDENANGQKAPVVYGDWNYPSRLTTDWLSSDLFAIGYLPACTPAIPIDRDSTNPDTLRRLIWNDCKGLNSGWTDQPDFGASAYEPPTGIGSDLILIHHADSNTITQVRATAAGLTAGLANYVDGSTANEECLIQINEYLRCFHFAPADAVVDSNLNGSSADPENAIDRDPNTYASLDMSQAGDYIILRLPALSKYGYIAAEDNAVAAYVAIEGSSISTAVLEFGLWRTVGGGSYIGAAGADTLSAATMASTGVEYQNNLVAADYVRAASGVTDFIEPLLNWTWQYSDGSGSLGDVYVKIAVNTTGTGVLKIVGAGVRTFYQATQGGPVAVAPRVRGSGRDRVRETVLASNRFNPSFDPGGDTFGSIYLMPGKSSLDDGSGTITGTPEQNIVHPVHIAHHLLRKWVDGLTGSDFETATTTFGTFASSNVDRLDRWIDQNVAGGGSLSWLCNWTIGTSTTVDQAIDHLCSQTPMMIQRDPSSGKFVCIVYENDSPQNWEKLLNSAGTQAYLHPNHYDRRGLSSDRGKPYNFEQASFGVRDGKLEGIATGVRVRFRRFAPTGAYLESVYANPDEQKVWSETAGDYVTGSSGTLYDACNTAETTLGYRTKDVEINADTIQDPATATGLLWYLVTRLTGAPIGVRGFMGAEGCLLKPGHYFRVSDDTNLWTPVPIYGGTDWVNSLFLCTKAELSTRGTRPLVYFEGVEWRSL